MKISRIHIRGMGGILLTILVVIFCDAPRQNPLDPHNSTNVTVTLKGAVKAQRSPQQPLEDATVIWHPGERVTETDADGEFQFTELEPDDGWLWVRKNGYQPDSAYIEWGDQQTITQNILLKENPCLCGTVKSVKVPRQPIVNATVIWHAEGRFTHTASDGTFRFDDVASTTGWLSVSKSGYKPDSVFVEWGNDPLVETDFFLNAIPILHDFNMISTVLNNYPDRKSVQLEIKADVTDPEKDISSVFVQNTLFEINAELEYNVSEKLFERTFSAYDLGITSIRELVGYPFDLIVKDESSETFQLGQEQIERVVLDEIECRAPLGGESITNPLTFEWKPFNPGFEYSYVLEIYTDDFFNPQLVFQQSFAASDSFKTTLDNSISGGNYFWVIWCVDSFQNRSRSKPATFIVE